MALGGPDYGLVMGKSNEGADPSPPEAPLLSREVALRDLRKQLSLRHLGGALWSGWNTGAHGLLRNHWYLEEGLTPATLVGARSIQLCSEGFGRSITKKTVRSISLRC